MTYEVKLKHKKTKNIKSKFILLFGGKGIAGKSPTIPESSKIVSRSPGRIPLN